MPPQVAIVGAGLSGLTLGLCLKHKGRAFAIYDRAASPPHYNYAVSLRPSTYRPLLPMLNMTESTFRESVAVNVRQDGISSEAGRSNSVQSEAIQCHRGRLEALLRKGVPISWGKRLTEFQLDSQAQEITTIFDDGDSLRTDCLIGCDGPHSMIRQSLSLSRDLEVLPYVVFNGKRRITKAEYMEIMQKYMQGRVSIETHIGDARLEFSINDVADSHVSVSYTYSRPAKGRSDPLHNPSRPTSGATDIPEEFFTELRALKGAKPPFREIFDADKVRDDRLLHWLMRCFTPDLAEAKHVASLADQGVLLIGDAAHATPILGGDGANMAISDAIELSEHIATRGADRFGEFLEAHVPKWSKAVEESKRRIREMHSGNSGASL